MLLLAAVLVKAQTNPDSTKRINRDDSLKRSAATLKEVTVTAEKKRLEVSGAKIVLNVQNSPLYAGASALDVLKTLPGITIGQDDNIALRGSSGVNVMLDGKMTFVSGKELAQLLRGTSAENISKIELLTAPPAEFDASGNAGIINIVTKKNQRKGYAVDVRSAISKGHYWMVNENITASLRTRQFSFNGSLDFNTPHRFNRVSSGNTIRENDADILIRRQYDVAYKIKFYTYRVGVEWQPSPRHQLMAGYSGYKDDFKALKFSEITKYDLDKHPLSVLRSTVSIIEPYYYDAVNLGYQFDIDPDGKKLTADAHYIAYRNYSDNFMSSVDFTPDGSAMGEEQALRISQPGFIKIQSYKIDGEFPFKFLHLKTGLKYSRVTNDNKYDFDSLIRHQFEPAASLSDHFQYKEEITAAYATASKKVKQTTFVAGLRVEHTSANGYTVKQTVNNQWEYAKLFPSFSIDHLFNENNRINIAASRRIERPTYASLNPVRWYNDPYFFYSGNADLRPEMGWLFATTYTWKQLYILSINYSRRTDFLSRELIPDPATNALISRMTNFSRLDRVDVQLSVPWECSHWWKVQGNAGIYYMAYPISQLPTVNKLSRWAGNVQLQHQLQLPGKVSMEVAMNWYSTALMGIYKKNGYFFTDLGCKRSFFGNKLDARFSLSDVFGTNHYKAFSLSNHTDYFFHDRPDNRRVGLSLTWHFGGKLQTSQARRIEEQDRL